MKRSKSEKSTPINQVKLQKEIDRLRKENESLKDHMKQKDARLAVLSASFDSSRLSQNVVEAFDMENMFRQAAIDAEEHIQRLLKTIHIKPEDFQEVKAELERTKAELTKARKELNHADKQLELKKKECETLLEEKRSLTLKSQSLPTTEDFRTLEHNYRCRIIALKDELKQKNSLLDQYTNRLPGILSKIHTSEEYWKLEEELREASKRMNSLSCVLDENDSLKTNILNLEREKEVLRDCVKTLEKENHDLKVQVEKHLKFERNLPPDAKTAAILQQELVTKDLSLKRQHDDFVKQLNDMQVTVTYLRLQYDKYLCAQNDLERKKHENKELKEELQQATLNIELKDQQIKDLESHFVIRRSGMQHNVVSLEKKLKSTQLELIENKRTITKLIEDNKKLSSKLQNDQSLTPIKSTSAECFDGTKVEVEFFKQQLLEEKQKLREEKRQLWKAHDKIKHLEIACHDAIEKLLEKEKEAQSKQQTQRLLLERKDRTINELRNLALKTDYDGKLPKIKSKT